MWFDMSIISNILVIIHSIHRFSSAVPPGRGGFQMPTRPSVSVSFKGQIKVTDFQGLADFQGLVSLKWCII